MYGIYRCTLHVHILYNIIALHHIYAIYVRTFIVTILLRLLLSYIFNDYIIIKLHTIE